LTLELKIPPLILFLASLAAMRGAATALPGADFTLPYAQALAAALALAGLGVGLAGIVGFWRHSTTVHPMHPGKARTIVESGVFRYTRNPMYLGLAGVLLAYGVHLRSAAALLVVVAFVAYISRFQVVPEERAMLEKFGADYAEYLARVSRWL
jgi:protein-S-isoprenylcysteine O-methyltransferase Ste14